MSRPSSYDLAKVIRDLLTIAKVAMPEHLYEIDPRVRAGQSLLSMLNASRHRPPSIARDTGGDIPDLGEADPNDPMTHKVLAALSSVPDPDWDIAAALDAFMAEPDAPVTRPAAISLILRDWLVGHGYLDPAPDDVH